LPEGVFAYFSWWQVSQAIYFRNSNSSAKRRGNASGSTLIIPSRRETTLLTVYKSIQLTDI